jgi:hypothetical protein
MGLIGSLMGGLGLGVVVVGLAGGAIAGTPPADTATPITHHADLARIPGRYTSQIWSGNNLIPSTTIFRQSADGTLSGSYTMEEQGTQIPGTLTPCQPLPQRRLRCQWSDRYGNGSLIITFTADFSRFTGSWHSDTQPEEQYPWMGSR